MHEMYNVSDCSCFLQASEKRYKTQLGHAKEVAVSLPECEEAAANGISFEQVRIHIKCLASCSSYLVTGGGITSTIECGGADHHAQPRH